MVKASASLLVSRAFVNKPWDVSALEPSVRPSSFLLLSGRVYVIGCIKCKG